VPKKMYVKEPPVIFNELLAEVRASQPEGEPEFTINTDDPAPPPFAAALIEEHYPPQSQLPLD